MDFVDESDGERQFSQTFQSVTHGADIIHDLVHIAGTIRRKNVGLGREQVLERTLGAFDLAGENGLFPNVHEDEKIGIRQCLDGAVEAPECTVRRREQRLEFPLKSHRWHRCNGPGMNAR